jgi:predicted ATP-grasp superfamily ATP-dependent carboligase
MSGGNLLVVGLDVAAIAASARRSGHDVYAVDYFGDRDTQAATQMNYSLLHQAARKSCGWMSESFSPAGLVELATKLARRYPLDGILLASGLEDSPTQLRALKDLAPILGNPLSVIAKVRNKEDFFDILAKRNICCPETVQANGIEEAEEAVSELGYPVIVKPMNGFGGGDVKLIQDSVALRSAISGENEVLVQEYVQGVAASASVIGTGKESAVLTLNEQILGVQQLGASGPFTYCGNIVPLVAADGTLKKCEAVCTEVSTALGLVGSNGVDFVLDESGQPWIVEVNPRFQGTAECVEKVLGINLVEAHITACGGRLTHHPEVSPSYCTRLVLYGRQRCSVPDLSIFTEVRDIPFPGVIIEKGEPVCSIVTEGRTKAQSFGRAGELAGQIYDLLVPE